MDIQEKLKSFLPLFSGHAKDMIRFSYTPGLVEYPEEEILNLQWRLPAGFKVINLLEATSWIKDGLQLYVDLVQASQKEAQKEYIKLLAGLYNTIPQEFYVGGANFEQGIENIFKKLTHTCEIKSVDENNSFLQSMAKGLDMKMPTLIIRDVFPNSDHQTTYNCYLYREIGGKKLFIKLDAYYKLEFARS